MPPVIARPLFAAALLTTAVACRTEPVANAAGAGAPPPPAVTVAPVELREVSPTEELTGRVAAVDDVEIRARVAGHVTAVRFRDGEDVAKGQVLFTIDPRPYQAVLARAKAAVASAQARADLARTEATRADKLFATHAIPQAERDVLAATAAQAAAELAGARAGLEAARLDVEFTQVRAPIAGRTSRATVSTGDFVMAGGAPTALTSIATTGPVHVYFTRNESSFLRVSGRALGAPVEVGLANELGFPHAGMIDFIDNHVDASTGTIRMRALLPNADGRLTPGLHARVRLTEGAAAPTLLVDDKAILTDQDRKYVYVLAAGDTVERRDVKVGRLVDGMRVVTTGVQAGERVITNGIQKVFPGSKATIAPPKAAAATGVVP